MNDRSDDGTGDFEVEIRANTAKFSNMIIARFRESRESKVFIKDKTKITRRVSSNQCGGINFGQLLWQSNEKKLWFRGVAS